MMRHSFAILLLAALLRNAPAADAATPVYTYRVVRTFPHDPSAWTEGLFYDGGVLWESTGDLGHSMVRRETLETGQVLAQHRLPESDYGEGIVRWRSELIELTWKEHLGYIYDAATLKLKRTFSYPGEGWALTKDAHNIYMSDGTPDIRVLDPATLREVRRIHVTDDGLPIEKLNELEYVKGEIYANIWETPLIARIDPISGHVMGWIDLAGLASPEDVAAGHANFTNGIAYDAGRDRLFVTGKYWSKLFQIVLVRRQDF